MLWEKKNLRVEYLPCLSVMIGGDSVSHFRWLMSVNEGVDAENVEWPMADLFYINRLPRKLVGGKTQSR